MTVKILVGCQSAVGRTARSTVARTCKHQCRTYAAPAATSKVSEVTHHAIRRGRSLSNPDPLADSPTAQLVSDAVPYMVPTYVRPMPMFERGSGCYLYDVEGREYLDFTAGIAVNALGHCDKEMAAILAEQSQKLVHCSNLYHNPWTGALSRILVEQTVASGGMARAAKAFICNSGAEANEAAIKFARKYGSLADTSGRKHQIVSFHGSFHGRTMGALSATPNTKYQKPFGPMIPGFTYGSINDVAALEKLITDETCGVIIEPIQGEGGINVASDDFLLALRRRCSEVDAVLIYDEIQCGLGRTGRLWAHSHAPAEAQPDILTTAKALGNGFPIGATIVTDHVSSRVVTGDHGTTFGGNPLGSRVAHSIVSRLASQTLHQAVIERGNTFRSRFERLQQRFPGLIKDIRGRGLILGVELSKDVTKVITAARERGLLLITCGVNTLRFVPPLIITDAEIDKGMAILEAAMSAVFDQPGNIQGTDGQQEMRAGQT